MRFIYRNRFKYNTIKIKMISILFLSILFSASDRVLATNTYTDDEVKTEVEQIFQNRSKAIISQDLEYIQSIYDLNTKFGTWAYEYEQKKMKYINSWGEKQGVKFTQITPKIKFRRVRGNNNSFSINLQCIYEYKYIYEDNPLVENSSSIGTYHNMQLVNKDGVWIITKEWYKDPFGDSLNLENIKVASIKEFILSQLDRNVFDIGQRRRDAAAYAEKFCGAGGDELNGLLYNKKYRNYNSLGGDCANFASQILAEGGKFRRNSAWNYDSGGATRSWVNADGFKAYMTDSGRASVIAYGNYDKVYKASYKLLPGDFVAYEKKGDITHISVVTGSDSRGYSLVSCHNTDRNNVPWDLGWSNKKIKFWLVHVNF